MGAEDEESLIQARKIEIEQDVEGDRVDSGDYFFNRIGKPIPILNDQSESPLFDLQSPPSSPLAVSPQHGLIFLVHSSGFYVARTKDVMDAAEEIKGTSPCIQDLSIADVPIGKPHILSLSFDSSTLVVTVAAHLHFFLVDSLLNKEVKPFFSCSLSEPTSFVKDFKWRRRSDSSYLLLSNHGNLYHAAVLDSPLKLVMDDVDAVEWSLKGTYLAVAKAHILHILSSNFKERLRLSLPFKSWIADSDDSCSVKVDSIRWVRPDSIVVGCFQQTADGKEENYLVQVIRSKDGKITDVSVSFVALDLKKPSVLSYYDLFSGLIDDILPYGNGPYLLLSYLHECGLAITANRKNTDQHVLLLCWSVEDGMSETAIVDIDRDTWIPRIELQGNGDDNLIMGFSVDNVSIYAKVEVEVGLEQRELSPFCVLFCVTLEGKLVMFYVASAAGTTLPPDADSALDDEEEDSLPESLAGRVQSNILSGPEQVALGLQVNDVSKREPDVSKGSELSTNKDLPSGDTRSSMTALITEQKPHKGATSEAQEAESVLNSKPSVFDCQDKASTTKMYQDNKIFSEFRPGTASFLEKAPPVPSQVNGKGLQKSANLPKDSRVIFGSPGLHGAPSQPWSSEKVICSGGSDSKTSALTSTLIQGHKSDNTGLSVDAANVPLNLAGKPFHLKGNIGDTPSANFSVRPTHTVVQKAKTGMIDLLPSIRSSQLPSQESLALGRSGNRWPYSSKDAHKAPSLSKSEPYLSRQFGNIKEMAKELDSLLECIEEPGGFKDACTISQRGSVEALEERMQTLSEKCITWKSMMDEQLGEVQHLLDKTVQVLARKIYMDGIVKQASDSRYWELWNRQKLGSEFELKRRHILKLNQVLTNQLIDLERHFNTLELHKFDENGGVPKGRREFQSRHGPSRQIQSLHSLYNTTNSQLAAAEHLSECLSKQMAVLSVESPVKQKNIKKELFETIGIPYETTFSSPDSTKVGDSSSSMKLLLSGSASNKSQSRRRQLSVMKSSDSETARRRRDSLDQSWASFEPKKTTVKRVLLQETQKTSVSKSSLMDRQQLDNSVVDSSAVNHPKDLTPPSTLTYPSGNKGIQFTFQKQALDKKPTPSRWASDSLPPSQSTAQATGLRPPMLGSGAALPSISPYQALPITGQILSRETGIVTSDELSGTGSTGKSDSLLTHESKSIQQSETNLHKKSSVSMELPAQAPTLMKSNEMLNCNAKGAGFANSRMATMSHVPTNTKGAFLKSHSISNETSFSLLTSASPLVSSHPGTVPQFSVAASRSQPSEKASSSQAFSMPLSFSSSPVINSSFGISLINSKDKVDATQTVLMTPFSSVSSPVFPSGSFSLQAPKSPLPMHTPPAVSESRKTELQSATDKMPPPVNPALRSISESVKTEAQIPTVNTSLPNSPTPSPSVSISHKPGLQSPTSKTSPSTGPTSPLTSEPSKSQLQPLSDKFNSGTTTTAPKTQPEPPAFSLKLETPVSSVPASEISTGLGSGSQSSLNSMASPASGIQLNVQPTFGAPLASDSMASGKNANMDLAVTEEDEMEEEAPEASRTNEISLGSFGLGSTPASTAPRANPFGNIVTNQASSSFTMTVPSGELFKPASFSFQSPLPLQPSPPSNMGTFSGGYAANAVAQAPAPNAFAQPAQMGAGQQALGSVLGSFGQSRQFGAGLTGGFASASSMGGFSSAATGGGFAAAATGGGFASLVSGGFGGFAGVASGGGGFGGVASGGGGFGGVASGGGGFGGVASGGGGFAGGAGGGFAAAGGGFGAFNSQQGAGGFSAFSGNTGSNQQGSGGFSAFSGSTGGTGKPPELFTQMRK
ncbi:nuclear pore complex protein nup153, putative [Ricinus communis]|uniref:Nuclear pore complex protein nup153, putative n=1 Tax=Ricinus communis TaxID=3988 RepID=B9SBM1_RICCO|nr:nuclear pore complex protein nup153, putative [Ricinus communis]